MKGMMFKTGRDVEFEVLSARLINWWILDLDNIEKVVSDGLCTGCGMCAGICPIQCIVMQVSEGVFFPNVNERLCTECHLCLDCCPGRFVNIRELSKLAQGAEKDSTCKDFPECYVGHSTNERIRYNASSGGVATQLLVLALEQGQIDGAIVTRMKRDNPLEPETIVARTREEIVNASKSKYCPTATNEAVRSILKQKGRYAVVGLPCQIHGIRKAEQNVKALKERIVLHVGLMCSHTVSFHGTDFLLRKMGLVPEQVASIDYRGLGWPGCMLITQRGGSKTLIPYVGKWNAYWPVFSSFFFTPKRCLMCPDETNELADIALGDAWLPELRKERNGESIVIVRTKVGERILSLACSNDVIFLRPVDCNAVELSQAHPIKFKKTDFGSRLSMIQSAGMKIPSFSLDQNSSFSFFSFARNFVLFFNVKACENRFLKRFLVNVPFAIFRLYYGVYRLLLLF